MQEFQELHTKQARRMRRKTGAKKKSGRKSNVIKRSHDTVTPYVRRKCEATEDYQAQERL